ncbi:MAG: RNA polymerase subunit sigma-70, partial [Phenylobacterium sp.]|uniref:sigma factor-like helix-turn-helix DNA-binding protein n=1 Tax=Phenylobacterium sp. TaxID=1871053 RepID=UPI001A2B1156|nr:RNA polymerase subunit sigma-70 [Phenylobacterium sp.]
PVENPAEAADATDEAFWEWYQPDDVMLWEDILPAEDVQAEDLSDERTYRLTQEERQALVLSVEHRLSVVEIASVMNLPPERTLRLIDEAGRQLGSA